ncbi:MAG: iron-containing redox enzyme family protein [Planctomycetaceae bacterium]|nr:iron-containing redox enzyme family protein [Planctomycetaceae bacterium]
MAFSTTASYAVPHTHRKPEPEDFGFNPDTLSPQEVLDFLDSRIQDVIKELQASEIWQAVSSPETDQEFITELMKEVYLETVMYQEEIVEGGVACIAQMPRCLDVSLFDEMLHHQVEEFDHGEMMLRDFIGLGGSEEYARNRRMSPTAFSAAAAWRMLVHMRDPFAYLGALYPFEGLTPIVSEMVKSFLKERGFGDKQTEFIEYHSTADLEHTRLIRELILKVCEEYPEAKTSICYGIEYYLAVYPMPLWNAAFKRAKKRLSLV